MENFVSGLFDIKAYGNFSSPFFENFNEIYFRLCIEYLCDESIPKSARLILDYLLFSKKGLEELYFTYERKMPISEMLACLYDLSGESSFHTYFDDVKKFVKELFIQRVYSYPRSGYLIPLSQPFIIFVFGNRGAGKTTGS